MVYSGTSDTGTKESLYIAMTAATIQVCRSDMTSDDGATKCVGGMKAPSSTKSMSMELLDESISYDLEASFASHSHNEGDNIYDASNSQYEQEFFESILEPLEGEDNEEDPSRDKTSCERRQDLRGMRKSQLNDSSQPRPPRPGGHQVVRANSDHRGPAVSRSGSGRAVPRRGLSASCSMMSYEGGLLNSGAQLSREKSKLCKLSSQSSHQSGHDNMPNRSVHRRRSSKSVVSTSSDDSLDENGSFAQLQVGDVVMLGNKEVSTSIHLRRRMPRRGRTGDDLEDAEDSSHQLEARMDALKA